MIVVRTFDQVQLRKAARELLNLAEDSGFRPELIVSVANGGTRVVESIEDEIVDLGILTESLLCQRPSTPAKERIRLKLLIKQLPLVLRNAMRVMEHIARPLLEGVQANNERDVTVISPNLSCRTPPSRILVIDDAVDSGDTLVAVERFLRARHPSADIRFGVLTQTRNEVSRDPDYSLYKSVLIRFPWSSDYRCRNENTTCRSIDWSGL